MTLAALAPLVFGTLLAVVLRAALRATAARPAPPRTDDVRLRPAA